MPSFLDSTTFNFSLPEAQALHRLLWTNIDTQRALRAVMRDAGISAALVHMEQPTYLVWHEVLEVAAKQMKVRALLDAAGREPIAGAALRPRLDELGTASPAVEVPPSTAFEWFGDEVFTGDKGTLLHIRFLALGSERARSVVRLIASFDDLAPRSVGTGFLIGPDLVLSNHHVLFRNGKPATRVEVWFDYELTVTGEAAVFFDVAGDPASIRGDQARDCATVKLSASMDRPPLPVETAAAPAPDDRVYIIQHPAGGPKKIGMVHNTVRHVDSNFVQYLTDTLPGSSGSPVFNEEWKVVALHHRSVKVTTAKNDTEWRNQGVRIDAVMKAIAPLGS